MNTEVSFGQNDRQNKNELLLESIQKLESITKAS